MKNVYRTEIAFALISAYKSNILYELYFYNNNSTKLAKKNIQ